MLDPESFDDRMETVKYLVNLNEDSLFRKRRIPIRYLQLLLM